MEDLLRAGPAGRRLSWLLDGLNGGWSDQVNAAEVMAPEFAAMVSPERYVRVMKERATRLAPVQVVGLDVAEGSAVARFRAADGDLWVARTDVEPDRPHRIVSSYVQRWVPEDLAPALPTDFTVPSRHPGAVVERPTGATEPLLMVFTGVPGSGKSTLAELLGDQLGIMVFAGDWLLGALSPFGLRHRSDLGVIGEELLVTLAYRELRSGRSAIVDTTTEDPRSRRRWEGLAWTFGARFVAVACTCSDRALHRDRVEHRDRGIPGWHDASDWADVEARLSRLVPWAGAVEVDTAADQDDCVRRVLSVVSPE
ncbi:AAA family ATPase [uncultured Friedmanniella sp.]|uniref:AAA family ATPase n=1 Tax=uncultured Friedmanniella sp. TaxID=335381 RepID=UPI0035CB821B